ncbi:MAG: RNHCP domain-containing protein [Candidatus Gracilibacteria bacterium]|jgi:DNA-directed RNA polymerase subunit RPC12/RpoP
MFHINESFVCKKCGTQVPPQKKSCRNHCTNCLYSLHVDDKDPGDRTSTCHGLMEPVGLEYKGKKGYQIIHKCLLCGKKQLNMVADDDNQEEIVKINLRR